MKLSNGENISIRKIRDSNGLEPTDGKGFHEGLVWDDVNVSAESLRQGASAPDTITIPNTNLKIYAFDGANTSESLDGTLEILHPYKEGSTIRPHIHWTPTTINTGNVKWFLEYAIVNIGEAITESTIITAIQESNGVAFEHQAIEFPPIVMPEMKIGAQFKIHLYRTPSDIEDTYPNDAGLYTIGYHYQKDGDGSNNIFTK